MKVLVTGAAGFLGRHVVARLLADGTAVRALVRSPGPVLPPGVECVVGDLRDPAVLGEAVHGVQAIVHAAARVKTHGTWEEFETVNVLATQRLIEAARDAAVDRVVHISSLAVYDVGSDGAMITEDGRYEGGGGQRGFYTRTKLIADRLALQAGRGGAPVTVLRPGLLYGPGRRPPMARQSIGIGPFRIIFGSRRYLLPLSYVENVADAIALAVRTPSSVGRAYTLVDAHVPQAEHLRHYRRFAGERWCPVYVPASLLMPLAWSVEWGGRLVGRQPPVTRHQLRRMSWSGRYDCSRAMRELGWQPRVPFEDALRRSFQNGTSVG